MSEMWDSVAEAWEANADFVDGHLEEATRRLLDAAHVEAGIDVLDLACGAGGAGMAAAARVGATGSVVLADDAPNMVEAAARRSSGLGHVSTLLCGQGDIPVADETFDAVISRHGLMFAEDPAAAVAEALRVVKTGGRYAAMTWADRGDNPWLGLILDAVGDEFGVPFPPPGVLGPFALDDPDRLAEVFERGGAREVRVDLIAAPMSIDSLEGWWDQIPQLAGPVAIALEGMDPRVRESIHQRALEAGREEEIETPHGISMGGMVLIASGLKA